MVAPRFGEEGHALASPVHSAVHRPIPFIYDA
jgi:hypothetical protein